MQTEHVQHDEITLEHLMSISTGSIKTFDNWLSEEDHHKVLQYTDHDGQQKTLYGLSFDKYGESEFDENTPNSGLAHIISPNHPIYTTIASKVKKHTDSTIYDMSINCIPMGELPFWHPDIPVQALPPSEKALTFLYYPHKEWDVNEGGETHFVIDKVCYALPPLPNRMVMFDSRIVHRATPFRNRTRFSVAIKVATNNDYRITPEKSYVPKNK